MLSSSKPLPAMFDVFGPNQFPTVPVPWIESDIATSVAVPCPETERNHVSGNIEGLLTQGRLSSANPRTFQMGPDPPAGLCFATMLLDMAAVVARPALRS